MRPTKYHLSPRIAQSDQSSLSARRNFSFFTIENAPSEDSDQPAHAQADLNLRWAHMSEGTFSDVRAYLFVLFCLNIFIS